MFFISSIKRRINSKEIKVLIENFASLSVLQLFSYILPLITLPYLVRILGVEKFGTVAFALAFIQYFQILTDYGFSLSATREISINNGDTEKISEIFSSVMIIKVLLMILSFIILIIVISSFSKFSSEAAIYYLTFGMVLGNVLFPIWFFQGIERMKYITILNVIANLIFTVSIFIFIKEPADYLYVPLLNSLGIIISGILSLGIIFKNFHIKFLIPSKNVIINTMQDSTQYFLSRASVSIYTASNTFFLGIFTNNLAVGYYSAAEKLYSAVRNLFYPLSNALYPYMAKNKNKVVFRKLFKISIILNLIIVILLFILSEFLITLLFGNNFQESINVLRILCLAILVVVPSVMLGYPFLAALGYQKYANGSIIIGSIFHLVALLLLSQFFFNVYVVAFLVVVTEIIVLITRTYGIKKHNLW